MRIAVIEVGSHSLQLLIVESSPDGTQRALAHESIEVALAEGLAKSGEIQAASFQEAIEAFAFLTELAHRNQCESVMAFGTAALREAANAGRFIEETARLGVPLQVFSMEEETRLVCHAVARVFPSVGKPTVILDVDELSTRMAWMRDGQALAMMALPCGSLRLKEYLADPENPSVADLRRIQKTIQKNLKRAWKISPGKLPKSSVLATTNDLFQNLAPPPEKASTFSKDQLRQLKRKFWRAKMQEPGIESEEAPSNDSRHLHASWILGIMDWLDVSHCHCLAAGLCEGVAWEMMGHGGMRSPATPEFRKSSIEDYIKRYDHDRKHGTHVAALADRLFLDLQPFLHLGDSEREWLNYASQLHEIGIETAGKDYHKVGAELIANSPPEGFWKREINILSQVVRFHRGKHPSVDRHGAFARLEPWDRHTVEKLAAILRITVALDRSHRQTVEQARIGLDGDDALIRLEGMGDLHAELEELQDKSSLLSELLDRPIRTVVIARC